MEPLIRTEALVKAYRGRTVVQGVGLPRGIVSGQAWESETEVDVSLYHQMKTGALFVAATRAGAIAAGQSPAPWTALGEALGAARMGMGYLAQEPSIFRKLTVSENIMAILETRKLTSRQRKQKLSELMEDLGISGLANQKAFTLSGGERRRLEIARALVTDPAMILLDEPFSGVDPLAVYDVQEIIKSLKQRGLGILITDHSVRETLSIVDRAYLICEGRVLREGTSDFLIHDEVSRELYLGPRFSM